MDIDNKYYNKYLKYKTKYLELKEEYEGGGIFSTKSLYGNNKIANDIKKKINEHKNNKVKIDDKELKEIYNLLLISLQVIYKITYNQKEFNDLLDLIKSIKRLYEEYKIDKNNKNNLSILNMDIDDINNKLSDKNFNLIFNYKKLRKLIQIYIDTIKVLTN
jgi:hypothetical protein